MPICFIKSEAAKSFVGAPTKIRSVIRASIHEAILGDNHGKNVHPDGG